MQPQHSPVHATPFSPPASLQGLYFPVIVCVIPQCSQPSPDTVIRQGQSTNLSCSEKKSSNTVMYWFKLPLGKDSRLILVASAIEGTKANVEEEFRSRFSSSEIQGDSVTLLIQRAFLNDSGMYYCAESETQWLGC
uniref:Ig-like domain-containing protein n=1 Tax=Aquila chrysaetos chrysaetos TaxID=223781 RepID=A0A663FFN2_AQUCH